MQIIIDFPWYYALFCLLAGAGFSALLYCRDRHRSFPRRLRFLLATLRFVAVSAICFLLLAPLVKRNVHQTEKPILLVAQDNSRSPWLCADSAYYRTDYAEEMEHLLDGLIKDYQIERYLYGEQPVASDDAPTYEDKSTDMSVLLSNLAEQYQNRNVAGLLLTGDGICNQGQDPVQTVQSFPAPIYTVAMGDTLPRCDAVVAKVRCNQTAYLGNQFPVEITLRALQLKGSQGKVEILRNGQTLFRQEVHIESDHYTVSASTLLQADQPGLQHYEVRLTQFPGEASYQNNTRHIAVQVIDGRQKVAIVAAAPHPDVSALRQSIAGNQNYQVEVFLANNAKLNLRDYDLIILHQLPTASGEGSQLLSQLQDSRIPAIFIIGSQTSIPRFNALRTGLEIQTKLTKTNEVSPLFNPHFTHFTFAESEGQYFEQMPPLVAPFGTCKMAANAQQLFSARIGTVASDQPLIAFVQQQQCRYAFVVGEGLWRWRLNDYLLSGSHQAFDQLINKMLVFTAMRVNSGQFHVECPQLFRQQEPVVIRAELYNDNYEPVNTPEAQITLTHQGNTSHTYRFNRSGDGYCLNLGSLDPGEYRYKATTSFNGKQLSDAGSFFVEDLNLEALDLVANHTLLNTLSTLTGGIMLKPSQLEQLPQLLEQHPTPSLIYTHTRYTQLLSLVGILIGILFLLSLEWFLRKYNGEI